MRLHTEAVITRDPLGRIIYPLQKIDNTIAGVNEYMYPVTDWKDELIKDYTMNQRATLNVSGGGKVARYYVAGAFNQDNGLLKVAPQNNFNNNVDLKTYSLRSNVNVNLSNTTEMVVRMSGNFDDYSGPLSGGAQVYKDILRSNPVLFPPFYPKGEKYKYVDHVLFGNYDDGSGSFYLNPYADMIKGYREYSRSTMSVQLEFKQDLKFITEGLSFRTMLNINRYAFFDVTRAYNPFWYQAVRYDNKSDTYDLSLLNEESGTEYLDYRPGNKDIESNFYLESAMDYSRDISEDHNVSGVLVFMAQNRLIGNADNLQSSLPFRNIGLAGRATYAYKGKYFSELNFGYNASERFYKKNRWGFFPSAGLGWTISNEPFWASIEPVISKFKIRATYGLSGNDAIGSSNDRFLYLSEVNMSDASRGAVFGRDNGYRRDGMSLSRYSDPYISWEKATKSNLGLELTLLENWEIAADVYKEVRTNILQTRAAIPFEMGLSATPKSNVGKAEGQGVDLSVDYNKIFNNNFWIQGRANFTYATSKFLIYEESDYKNAPWKSHVGYSIGQRWGYLAERLFVDDEEVKNSPVQNFGEYAGGDIKYRDVNGDGQITELDQVPLGYPTTPEIVYGFGISIGYKKFDFSTFFQGSGRSSFWIDANATAPFINGNQLLKAYADDYWSEDNQKLDALWPRLSTTSAGNSNNSVRSTWFMRNGSFLRLKQIELGYSLSKSLLDRLYIESLRIYASGTNTLVWSNFKLWDVEMGNNGLGYPIQKVFNIGLQVNF
jgi:TonB-linked SusC/RagA family outer membrane protein